MLSKIDFVDGAGGLEMTPLAHFYRHEKATFFNRHFYDIFTPPLTPPYEFE